MNAIVLMSRYTFRECMGMMTTRLALMLAVVLPMLAWVFSQFFLLELTKVQLDVMATGAYILGILLILTSMVQLLGADIGGRLCYFYLTPPVKRSDYLIGRFLGCCYLLFLLYAIILVGSELIIAFALNTLPEERRFGLSWDTGMILVWTACYQTITLASAVFFIASWATGFAELLFFSIAACALFWAVPPVLEVMRNPFLVKDVPQWVLSLIDGLAWLLPDMNAGKFIVSVVHGQGADLSSLLMHMGGHMGYVLMTMALAIVVFSRRGL